jgi:putative hydrolase of the HAD superfamily
MLPRMDKAVVSRPPGAPRLDHVETWVFDLDNTLYPAACNLFDQIDRKMGEFIARRFACDFDAAKRMQKDFFAKYGTTLRGLMDEHGMDPADYLDYVHELDLDALPPSPALDAALGRLPGRKLIFTNGTKRHAERVTARLGIAHHFEAMFDIVDSDYLPKPDPRPYDVFVRRFAVDPRKAAMFEDVPRNLAPAAALGMTTVWIPGLARHQPDETTSQHIHHVAEDLAEWLGRLVPER